MSIGQCYMARQAPDKLEWHLANEIPFERGFSSFGDRLTEGHAQDVILPFRFPMVNPSFFRRLAYWVTALTNALWFFPSAAAIAIRSLKDAPLLKTWFTAAESHPSVTELALM